jgi:hypothetical protein
MNLWILKYFFATEIPKINPIEKKINFFQLISIIYSNTIVDLDKIYS